MTPKQRENLNKPIVASLANMPMENLLLAAFKSNEDMRLFMSRVEIAAIAEGLEVQAALIGEALAIEKEIEKGLEALLGLCEKAIEIGKRGQAQAGQDQGRDASPN